MLAAPGIANEGHGFLAMCLMVAVQVGEDEQGSTFRA